MLDNVTGNVDKVIRIAEDEFREVLDQIAEQVDNMTPHVALTCGYSGDREKVRPRAARLSEPSGLLKSRRLAARQDNARCAETVG